MEVWKRAEWKRAKFHQKEHSPVVVIRHLLHWINGIISACNKSIYLNNSFVVEVTHHQENIQIVDGVIIQNLLNALKLVSYVSVKDSLAQLQTVRLEVLGNWLIKWWHGNI